VQAIGDVRLALEGAFETSLPQTAAPAAVAGWRRVALAGVAAIVASGAIIGTLVWLAARRAEPVPPRVSRLQVTSSGNAALAIDWNAELAMRRTVPAITSATKARRSSSARSTTSRRWRCSPAIRAGCSSFLTGSGSDSLTAAC
jgi:hypothetical protein